MGDINSFGELENLVQPFFYSGVTPLPEVPPGSQPVLVNSSIKGFISEDCLVGCIYNQGVIQCFSVDTKLSDTHYTPKSHVPLCVPDTPYSFPPRCIITCSSEFMHNQRTSRGVRKLLLGLNCTDVASHYNLGGGNGALAIYDPIQRQVVKWISVPHPVTTVRVISHYERGDAIKPFYNGAMMAMVGIAAVGMVGGEVLIVDLGLDRTDFLPPANIVLFSSLAPQVQSRPFETCPVDAFDRLIAMKRHNAINQSHLICLSLADTNDLDQDEGVFTYMHTNGVELERYVQQDVSITAIEYISNIGCLLIGYNFGGFQIWRVDDLTLQYSSNIPETPLPVLSFGFQQPIDDPKNFCYIWVLYGAQNVRRDHSHLDLYQLFFVEKPHIDNFGYIYQNMQKCAKTLSIPLEDSYLPRNSEDSDDGDDEEDSDRHLVHPMRLWIMDELVFISWSVARPGLFYVGIFDLNQWYSSHTSASIPTGGLCSFWVTIPVHRSGSYGACWDFRLVPSSLVRWENTYKPQDVHQYPASITFQGACLSSDGLFCFEHFGLQEKIIRYILRDGHAEMSDPFQLRHICHTYGLQPMTSSIYEPDTLAVKDIERFYIFTALLESKRPALIVKMANIWLDGSFANVGCTIDLIIDWVRNLALAVRFMAEEHWYNTFNPQTDTILPETKKFISYSNFIWNSLYSLLLTLIRHDEVYNVSRIAALDDLKLSLEKLVQYSSAILLFCQAGILPSNDDLIDQLVEYYDRRRSDVRQALNNCDIIPEDVKKNHPCLVIDEMFTNFGEDFVRREWNLEPTEFLYPPRHAGYVVNMLLWRDVDTNLVSRVVFYFIMDFMKATGCFSSEVKGDFLSVIRLTPEDREELYNLWKIDHNSLQQPMSYLCQSQKFYKRDVIGTAWSTAATILIALGANSNTNDLYRSGCPPFLGKLYINVMAESRERFQCLMDEVCSEYSVVLADHDLLEYFFKVALKKGYLEEFINTKAKHAPETILTELVSFLEKTSSFDNQNLLVTYFIKSDKYEKAHQVHRNMKVFWGDGQLLNSMQKPIWNSQLEMMKKLPITKQESTIQKFLNMKSASSERVSQPRQTVMIKPVRILELCESSMDFETIQRPNNFMTQYQMSPLRRYIPQTVVNSKSPSNVETSLHDSITERDMANGSPSTSQSRRSIFVNVDSVLKTPTVDHRKRRRVPSTPESSKSNNSTYETPPAPEDEVHSILKKSEGSKGKPFLKTRFLDPASGQEFSSPENSKTSFVSMVFEDENEHPAAELSNILPHIVTNEEEEQENPVTEFNYILPQSATSEEEEDDDDGDAETEEDEDFPQSKVNDPTPIVEDIPTPVVEDIPTPVVEDIPTPAVEDIVPIIEVITSTTVKGQDIQNKVNGPTSVEVSTPQSLINNEVFEECEKDLIPIKTPDNSANNSVYGTPEDEGSLQSKSFLEMGFLDPASGQGFSSPDSSGTALNNAFISEDEEEEDSAAELSINVPVTNEVVEDSDSRVNGCTSVEISNPQPIVHSVLHEWSLKSTSCLETVGPSLHPDNSSEIALNNALISEDEDEIPAASELTNIASEFVTMEDEEKKTIDSKINGRRSMKISKRHPLTKTKVSEDDEDSFTPLTKSKVSEEDEDSFTPFSKSTVSEEDEHSFAPLIKSKVSEEDGDSFTPLITRSSLRSRSKSESPARVFPEEPTPPPKRKRGRRVFDYAPDLTTVMEATGDTSNMLGTLDESNTSILVMSRPAKRHRTTRSAISSDDEDGDDDDSMSDISTTSTNASKRGRRSKTATPTPEKVPKNKRGRRSMTPTTTTTTTPEKVLPTRRCTRSTTPTVATPEKGPQTRRSRRSITPSTSTSKN